jgi:hypothetical protein
MSKPFSQSVAEEELAVSLKWLDEIFLIFA